MGTIKSIRICHGEECIAYLYPCDHRSTWLDPHGGIFTKEQARQFTELAQRGGGDHVSLIGSRLEPRHLAVHVVFETHPSTG
jgi:hypothetical protein